MADETAGRGAHRLALPAALLANLCLSFGPLLVRLAQSDAHVGPVAAGFWRLAIALPILLLLVRGGVREIPALGRRGLAMLAVAGLFFAADLAAWHVAILHTRLANATLFGNGAAFAFPIYGFVVARRWPGPAQWAGFLLALAGTLLLLGRSYELSARNVGGDGLAIFAGLAYAVYLVMIERVRQTMAPLPALLAATAAGVVPILLFAWALGEPIWPAAWTPLLLLAIGSQVIGQGLLAFAVAHLSPLVMGLSLLLQPVVAFAIGWVRYGERLQPVDWVGVVAVCAALVLVRRGSGKAALGPAGGRA